MYLFNYTYYNKNMKGGAGGCSAVPEGLYR